MPSIYNGHGSGCLVIPCPPRVYILSKILENVLHLKGYQLLFSVSVFHLILVQGSATKVQLIPQSGGCVRGRRQITESEPIKVT